LSVEIECRDKERIVSSDSHDELDDEAAAAPDEWEELRDSDGDPIRIEQLKRLNLKDMPEDVFVRVMDDYFPETTLIRDGEFFVCEIEEHLYTKYWEHKFSAYAFAEARRLRLSSSAFNESKPGNETRLPVEKGPNGPFSSFEGETKRAQ
jgi:hypothetical protein